METIIKYIDLMVRLANRLYYPERYCWHLESHSKYKELNDLTIGFYQVTRKGIKQYLFSNDPDENTIKQRIERIKREICKDFAKPIVYFDWNSIKCVGKDGAVTTPENYFKSIFEDGKEAENVILILRSVIDRANQATRNLEIEITDIKSAATPAPISDNNTREMPKELSTVKAITLIKKLVNKGYCQPVGLAFQWTESNALFGYFVKMSSEKLGLRYDNDRLPWSIYQQAFGITDKQLKTAKNFISGLKSLRFNEPTGYEVIKKLCK